METELFGSITQLGVLSSIVVLVFCLFLVFKGRLEIATGLYLAISAYGAHMWTIAGIAQTWVLLVTMFAASMVFLAKNSFQWPINNRWIVPWLLIWWSLSLSLLFLNSAPYSRGWALSLILWTLFPLPAMLLFSGQAARVASFAKAYVIGTMMGGLSLLRYIYVEQPALMINPLTGDYGHDRLPMVNYHTFAYPYGVSIVFLIALYQLAKSRILRIFYICAMAYCFYFLYFSVSRQTVLATLVVSVVFFVWALNRKYPGKVNSGIGNKMWAYVLLVVGFYLMYIFYTNSSTSILRSADTLAEAVSNYGLENRLDSWQGAVQAIWTSHFMGTAYEAGNVHNMFLSVFANEGIIGFIFLVGFLLFSIKQMRNVWASNEKGVLSVWRMAFSCVFISTMIHSQYSGNNLSAPELFWSVAFLWKTFENRTGVLSPHL